MQCAYCDFPLALLARPKTNVEQRQADPDGGAGPRSCQDVHTME